ncbi:MAG: hypothetical protein AAB851_03630 [Patescibacteria group bacterium]
MKEKNEITFFFGLTNSAFGYILRAEDYHSGKYRYATNVSVGSDIGEEWKKAALELLEDK